ncbi:MAG: outer membrane beta-barrel protein [Myxococcota bacterium]
MSRRIALVMMLVGLGQPAMAAKNELSLEGGTNRIADPDFRTFARGAAMPTWGIRGGYAVHDRVALFGSLHTGQRGQQVSDGTANGFRTAYNATTLTLGAKADADLGETFAPYVSAGLLLHHGLVRLDDDPNRRNNPGQILSSSASFGATALAGFEIRFLPGEDIQPALHVEGGLQGVLPHSYLFNGESMLNMGYLGPVIHAGAGIRF